MKKANNQNSKSTPIDKTLNYGSQFIIGCSIAITITILFVPSPLLEILSTFAAVGVASFCLFQIFQEYNLLTSQENALTESLIQQIYRQYEHPPHKELIISELHNLLNKYPSHDARISVLHGFKENPESLQRLVYSLQNIQRDMDVIDELGLSWPPNRGSHPSNLRA